jgi:hypothetical protein
MLPRLFGVALLFAMSLPVMAQSTPPSAGAPMISPNRGQDQHQLQVDRYECYGWAKGQSGYDPAQPVSGANPDSYRRAFTACMSGRGYTVSYAAAAPVPAPAATPPPPPPGYPVYVRQSWWQSPELMYRPVHFAIEGGPTVTAGSTSDYLDDGGNVGVGISFFPSRSLPVGLRVDGSWTRLDANHGFYDSSGNFYRGHENIYGGDVDLQFNLAQPSTRYQFYLLGGAGWYREQRVLDQFGSGCGYYGCGPYYGGEQSSTTGWRSSWNAGIGGEFAMPQGTSFFVEARYQRIAPRDSDMQFVPIRVGLRF